MPLFCRFFNLKEGCDKAEGKCPFVHEKYCTNALCEVIPEGKKVPPKCTHTWESCGRIGGGAHQKYISKKRDDAIAAKLAAHQARAAAEQKPPEGGNTEVAAAASDKSPEGATEVAAAASDKSPEGATGVAAAASDKSPDQGAIQQAINLAASNLVATSVIPLILAIRDDNRPAILAAIREIALTKVHTVFTHLLSLPIYSGTIAAWVKKYPDCAAAHVMNLPGRCTGMYGLNNTLDELLVLLNWSFEDAEKGLNSALDVLLMNPASATETP